MTPDERAELTKAMAIVQDDELTQRARQRLDGQSRQGEFEGMLLECVHAHFGQIGRDYLQMRFLMASTFEAVLCGKDNTAEETGIGHA